MGSKDSTALAGLKVTIGGRARWLLSLWAGALLLIYIVGGFSGIRQLREYRVQTESSRQKRLEAAMSSSGSVATAARSPGQGSPVDVMAGIRVTQVGRASLKDNEWTAHFDIWFRWTGDTVEPGKTFEVVNGDIQQREKLESYVRDGRRYDRYHVTAQMVKHFDPSRFPFADEDMSIEIQDIGYETPMLQYVADQGGSGLATDALPQSVALRRAVLVSTAPPASGGEASPAGPASVHSRLIFAMLLQPLSTSLYLMMFQALFASVAVAMIVFFVRATYDNTRFALPLGAFFAAVANNIFLSALLPRADRLTLTGMVNAVGLGTIFLILVQSAISLYLAGPCDRGRLSRVFDRVSAAVILPGYVALNVLLPWSAMPS